MVTNLALALSCSVAVLNLAVAGLTLALSRAPGWRRARVFAGLAATAGIYSLGNAVDSMQGLPVEAYLAAVTANYLMAILHVTGWIPFVFGGPDALVRRVPRPLQAVAGVTLAVGLLLLVTGQMFLRQVTIVDLSQYGVQYHYAVTTRAGEIFGFALSLVLLVPLAGLALRVWRGERALRLQLLGFAVLVACGIEEALVANGHLQFVSLADVGFLAAVLPFTTEIVAKFVEDTRHAAALSQRLAGEVQERTEERDRAQSTLVESEQLVALGRLAAGVGHEINNPLAYLLVSLEEARAGLATRDVPPPVLEALYRAEDGARRIERVVQGLRAYSRTQPDRRPVDLHGVVRSALRVAGPNLRHSVRIDVDLRPTPAVLGDEPRLVQACVNLLVNAGQAAAENPAGGVVTVRTADDAGAHGVLSIADNGPGVPPEAMGRLGEPYFTTRARDGGLGLGLFVTRGIIDAHGGDLQFSSTLGRGTAVTVRLPAVTAGMPVARDPAPAAPDTAVPVGPAVTAATAVRHRVLLVDDDEMVSTVLSQALRRRHDVAVAASAREALACIEREAFDVVICDVMMPGMSGMDLAAALEASQPALRRRMLFLTGGAVTPAAEAFLARPDVRYLMKPVSMADLHSAIGRIAAVTTAAGG